MQTRLRIITISVLMLILCLEIMFYAAAQFQATYRKRLYVTAVSHHNLTCTYTLISEPDHSKLYVLKMNTSDVPSVLHVHDIPFVCKARTGDILVCNFSTSTPSCVKPIYPLNLQRTLSLLSICYFALYFSQSF